MLFKGALIVKLYPILTKIFLSQRNILGLDRSHILIMDGERLVRFIIIKISNSMYLLLELKSEESIKI
jgi:hypothetical protein